MDIEKSESGLRLRMNIKIVIFGLVSCRTNMLMRAGIGRKLFRNVIFIRMKAITLLFSKFLV